MLIKSFEKWEEWRNFSKIEKILATLLYLKNITIILGVVLAEGPLSRQLVFGLILIATGVNIFACLFYMSISMYAFAQVPSRGTFKSMVELYKFPYRADQNYIFMIQCIFVVQVLVCWFQQWYTSFIILTVTALSGWILKEIVKNTCGWILRYKVQVPKDK